MKLVTIDSREVTGRPGVLLDSGEILDLAAAPSTLSDSQWIPHSVVSVLAAGEDGLERIERLIAAVAESDREKLRQDGILLSFAATALMAPIRRPGLVLVVGAESDGGEEPEPAAFIKSPNTAAGHASTVRVPWSPGETVAAAGMLAIVVGRPFYQAEADEAEQGIAAYTLIVDLTLPAAILDGSAGEWRRYIDSKQFPGACPMGPAIVTKDEIDDPSALVATIKVNDVEVHSGALYQRDESIPETLARLSQRYGFRPGDIIAIEPSRGTQLLHNGDRLSLELNALMELEFGVSF